MGSLSRISVALLVATIISCTGAAGALSVALHPTEVGPGEKIFVEITDLPDGSDFTLLTEGISPADPGGNLTFQLTEFEIPFSLVNGEILVNVANSRHAAFKVKKGDTIATVEAYPPDGIFSRKEVRNISSGTYAYIRLEATPLSPDQPVSSVIQLKGIKQGPRDATLSFSIDGIRSGQVRIITLIDGTEYLNELITIGGGASSVVRGTVSPDGIAWLTGTSDSYTRLLVLKPVGVPDGWEAVTRSYQVVSSGTDLGSDAMLTITIPGTIAADLDRHTLFIAHAKDGSWEMLPSRILVRDGVAVITAPVREPGEYCLMTLEIPETPVPATRTPFPAPLFLAFVLTAFAVIAMRQK
jgi:hypothetical protein